MGENLKRIRCVSCILHSFRNILLEIKADRINVCFGNLQHRILTPAGRVCFRGKRAPAGTVLLMDLTTTTAAYFANGILRQVHGSVAPRPDTDGRTVVDSVAVRDAGVMHDGSQAMATGWQWGVAEPKLIFAQH